MVLLNVSDAELGLTKERLKTALTKKMNTAAFSFLIEKAKSHSKVNELLYNDCSGAEYFQKQCFTPDLANILFTFRTRCFLVNNFRNNYERVQK